MTDLFPEVPLEGQIKCVKREIGYRTRVYPNQIAKGRMTEDRADYEIRAMKAVAASLTRLRGLEP